MVTTGTAGSFVHLHTHTEFSLLDGASRIDELIAATRAFGMPAIAMTDHGAMYGALDFYDAATKAGVKPILGVEAYVAPGSRFERQPGESEEKYRHFTLLARNERGYRNLLKLVTAANLEGFYHRPRIDKELIAEHAEGLVGLSGCLASETARLLLDDQHARARDVVGMYADIFEPGGFYLELQDHGLREQRRLNPILLRMAKETGLPVVATNDLHYTNRSDAKPHDVLLCIQQQKVQKDDQRLKFDTEEFYLKSAQEMRAVFAEVPEACDATLDIAQSCELTLAFGEHHVPRFDPPPGTTLEGYLRQLVARGATERYAHVTPEIARRIDDELSVIVTKGFAGYFLIVWDLIRFAREHGVRVGPGRGSAAGSVVSYCLRITDLDPLRYGLIFERFLNPERTELPDIDMDFDPRGRDDVIRYVGSKYGEDHVAQIITFQTIKGKQGIRDAARVLDFPPSFGDRLCKMYPPAVLGREYSIEDALKHSPELDQAYRNEPEAREVIDSARALEGLRREDSVHAAGVVIADKPLVDYLPLKLAKDSRDDSRRIVTQFDMHGVEKLGLLKMDFLGLRNLSVIDDTVRLLRSQGVEVDVDHVPLDDPKVYEMLRAGDTTGVFQMEGAGMRQLIKQLVPDRFEDLMALNALYRPGPLNAGMHVEYAERKHGRRPVHYPHADLQDILEATYGVIVYQEQVMQVASRMAGYTMGEADTLRKVMGKKIREKVEAQRQKFVAGAVAKGYQERLAREIFDLIAPFADYGFNASHACAYALVGYQTAWLKTHHPVEYMAAMLTSVKDDKDAKPFYLNAARLMGIRVLPPDVNESQVDFAPAATGGAEEPSIRYGLSAVRNVGLGVVEEVIDARRSKGRFESFTDFCKKVDSGVLNKKVLESLILAGAFDSLGYARRPLLERHAKVVEPIVSERRAESLGQFSLFGGGEEAVERFDESFLVGEEFEKTELLRCEKEMLGQYVTDHPLLAVREALARLTELDLSEAGGLGDGDVVTVGGIVAAIQRKFTKRGEPFAIFRLEDLTGGVGVVLFPGLFDKVGDLVAPDRLVLVKGRADLRGRELQLVALEVSEPDVSTGQTTTPPVLPPSAPLLVDLTPSACTSSFIARLKRLFDQHPGRRPVVLQVVVEGEGTRLRLGEECCVSGSPELLAELRHLLGPGAVREGPGDGDGHGIAQRPSAVSPARV